MFFFSYLCKKSGSLFLCSSSSLPWRGVLPWRSSRLLLITSSLKSCKRAHPVAQELCAAHESPHKPQERLPVHSNSRFQQIRGERCAPSFPSFRVARSSFSVACGLHNIGWVPGSAAASTRGTWLGRARRPSISICNSTSAAQPTSCSGKLHRFRASFNSILTASFSKFGSRGTTN